MYEHVRRLMMISSLNMIVSSNVKARREHVRDIQRNTVHSASLSIENLTQFNRQTNIAYISLHAVPDLYSSFESVV